jgi:hypothetical protein
MKAIVLAIAVAASMNVVAQSAPVRGTLDPVLLSFQAEPQKKQGIANDLIRVTNILGWSKQGFGDLLYKVSKGDRDAILAIGNACWNGSAIVARLAENGKVKEGLLLGEEKGFFAAGYWHKGLMLGDRRCALNLGYVYEKGVGVEKDMAKAMKLYEWSARGGDPHALFKMAVLAERGALNMDKDIELATLLYRKAYMLGHLQAGEELERIGGEKPPVERKMSKAEEEWAVTGKTVKDSEIR